MVSFISDAGKQEESKEYGKKAIMTAHKILEPIMGRRFESGEMKHEFLEGLTLVKWNLGIEFSSLELVGPWCLRFRETQTSDIVIQAQLDGIPQGPPEVKTRISEVEYRIGYRICTGLLVGSLITLKSSGDDYDSYSGVDSLTAALEGDSELTLWSEPVGYFDGIRDDRLLIPAKMQGSLRVRHSPTHLEVETKAQGYAANEYSGDFIADENNRIELSWKLEKNKLEWDTPVLIL